MVMVEASRRVFVMIARDSFSSDATFCLYSVRCEMSVYRHGLSRMLYKRELNVAWKTVDPSAFYIRITQNS